MDGDLNARSPTKYNLNGAVGSVDTSLKKRVKSKIKGFFWKKKFLNDEFQKMTLDKTTASTSVFIVVTICIND